MNKQLYKVTKEHKPSFEQAIKAEKGEEVTVGKEDKDMPGWFWCKNRIGVEAWVPETMLEIQGTQGVFTIDYDSTELKVKEGEIVEYLGETLGWVECLKNDREYGWIPKDKLEKI
jgi:hypothetical protein